MNMMLKALATIGAAMAISGSPHASPIRYTVEFDALTRATGEVFDAASFSIDSDGLLLPPSKWFTTLNPIGTPNGFHVASVRVEDATLIGVTDHVWDFWTNLDGSGTDGSLAGFKIESMVAADHLGTYDVAVRRQFVCLGGFIICAFGTDTVAGRLTIADVSSTAVPEPASLALAGLALAGIAATRRRKQ